MITNSSIKTSSIDNYQHESNNKNKNFVRGFKNIFEQQVEEKNNNEENKTNLEEYGVPSFIEIGNELYKSKCSTDKIDSLVSYNNNNFN